MPRVATPARPAFVGVALLSVLLASCKVGPDFRTPPAPADTRYTEAVTPARTAGAAVAGGEVQRIALDRDIPGEWWELFHSQQITALVTQALKANPDVAAAQASLRQAKEQMRAGQGALFPSVGANASVQRQQESLAAIGFGNGSATFTTYGAGLDVSYTLDAFGGIRRQVEELGAQADYQRFELEATDLTLAANVINAAINEAALQARIDTTREIIKANTEALNMTKGRYQLGGVSQIDVLQQQTLLDQQTATLPGLQRQREQLRNQLAVYLGGRPEQYATPTLDLDRLTLPQDLPVSLPSKLVEQRPDIRAYEALLHSATASVGVATANMLPNISLSASLGREGTTIPNLFTPAGLVWTIAAGVAQPIFQGGTLKARQRAAQAALEVAAAQYSSTVNTAFRTVADALVAIERDAEALRASLDAQKTAAASLALVRSQYTAGAGTYLNVLTAEQADYIARLALISARAARFTDTVALFQALGGGWWNRTDVDAKVARCCGVLP